MEEYYGILLTSEEYYGIFIKEQLFISNFKSNLLIDYMVNHYCRLETVMNLR